MGTIPRIFMFDCCDGNGDYGKFVKGFAIGKNKDGDEGVLADIILPNSEFECDDIDQGKDGESEAEEEKKEVEEITVSSEATWAVGTDHPDANLAVLNASTWGFQSKLNIGSGSYLISGFVKRAESALKAKGYVPRIGLLFKDIQDELRKRKKQLPIYIWNGNTDNITLYPRGAHVNADAQGKGLSTAQTELEMVSVA